MLSAGDLKHGLGKRRRSVKERKSLHQIRLGASIARPRRKGGCGHSPSALSSGCFFGDWQLSLFLYPKSLTTSPDAAATHYAVEDLATNGAGASPPPRPQLGYDGDFRMLTHRVHTLLRGAKPAARCGPSMATRSTIPAPKLARGVHKLMR